MLKPGLANHRLQPLGHSSIRKTANRKLVDFIKQIENKEPEVPSRRFQDLADKWLESIKPHLKESS